MFLILFYSPAPTYYAHHAAFRGRVHIEGCHDVDFDDLNNENARRKVKVNVSSGHPMYFI